LKSSNPKHICLLCSSKSLKKISFPSCVVNYCTKCTLQFIKNPVSTNDYFEKYKKQRSVDSKYSKLRNTQYDIDATFLQKYLKSGNVLDVGCSDGIFLSKLNKYNNYNLIGIDPDSAAIEMAKKKFSKINFYNTNLLDFDTKIKFDCIIFRGSFQFLGSELKSTLKKIQKIGKKNSKIIIYSLPNSDSFLYHLLKEKWNLFDENSHKLIFNEFSIEKLCKLYNFEIEHISYPYLGTPYADPPKDYKKMIQSIRSGIFTNIPFWGNIMQFVLKNKK
jgi:SAM-dependent methyltransferase